MLKDKLFKFLFPKKFQRIIRLEEVQSELTAECWKHANKVKELKKQFSFIDFVNVDDFGKPPHPFKSLRDEEKKSYVFSVDQIYSNPKFKELTDYEINYFGNQAIRGSSEEVRHNAGIAIVAINEFVQLFKDAHDTADEMRQEKPGIEPEEALEIMPDYNN